MTYISQRIPGADFSGNSLAEMIPSYDDLDFYQLLGTSDAASIRNYAGTKASATVIGSPITYGTAYATTFSSTKGFEAPMASSTGAFTHLMVTEVNPGVGGGGYMGRWNGGGNQDLLFKNASNDLALAVDGASKVTIAMAGAGYHFIAGSHDGSTATVYVGAAGVLSKATAAHVGGSLFSSKLRVGANFAGGNTKVAAAASCLGVALAEADVLAFYEHLTRILAVRGITVN